MRPETAGKTSNPASGKYSFMSVCVFLGLETTAWPRCGRDVEEAASRRLPEEKRMPRPRLGGCLEERNLSRRLPREGFSS